MGIYSSSGIVKVFVKKRAAWKINKRASSSSEHVSREERGTSGNQSIKPITKF